MSATSRIAIRLAAGLVLAASLSAQERETSAPAALGSPLASLASFEFPVRMQAARLLRRTPAADAVPALTDAARSHPDEFVRYRALVLLTSFENRGTSALMRELMRDRNDRVREVVYRWFERRPDPASTHVLLEALQGESAEFVRPALIGALAAHGRDERVQRALLAEVGRGFDFFRSAVVEALGRHRATYALETIVEVATVPGPIQADAILALGHIGDPRARPVLAELAAGPAGRQPALWAAQCLLGEDCEAHLQRLTEAASAAGAARSTVRLAVSALSSIAAAGSDRALSMLYNLALHGPDVRAEAAIGFGTVAVRRPEEAFDWLAEVPADGRDAVVALLKEGFDSLEEDLAEEQFFAAVRAAYWRAPEGSDARALAATVIDQLEF